jgi:uncharacterized protein YbaP (TraB family)
MKGRFLIAICALLVCSSAWAETSLWEVRKNGGVTYLGGTCHMLRRADYPLPAEFEKAYRAAEVLVFEADPGQLTSLEMQQALAARGIYSDGTTLEQVLRPETWRMLANYCRRAGLQLEALESLKPPLLAMTLLGVELQRHGVDQGGVDLYFHEKALADRKRVAALETVDEQIDFILGMGKGNEDRFIKYALADLDNLDEIFDRLVAAWRKGNEEALIALIQDETRQEFPEIYRTLFSKRNAAWLPVVEKYIASPEKELVLVGVGHLVGEDGLVAALRRQGYEVSKVE